jgi:hypothetical protein
MNWYFKILLIFISLMLISCSSLNCKPGIIKYKINVNNIDNIADKETTTKNYVTSLIDSIIPGIKCLFY